MRADAEAATMTVPEQAGDMAWHARAALQPAFVNPRLRDYLASPARAQASSLRLTNRIAFAGDAALRADLGAFAEIDTVHPDGADGREDVDLLLIGGNWPRTGESWREALLNTSAAALVRLHAVIARYRARGIPAVLWTTGEAATADAFRHLHGAVDAVFGPGGEPLDAGVNVKVFNPFREDAAAFAGDAEYFRFLIDGAHEQSGGAGALQHLAPFLGFNSWMIDSTYHFQAQNMKLPAPWRRRFLGHAGPNMLARLLGMAAAVHLPPSLAEARPAQFRALAARAHACKTLVLTRGESLAGPGTVSFADGGELDSALAHILADDVAREAMAHIAWREAMSKHSMFERLEAILARAGVRAAYSEPARPSVNVVVPTIRPELIPFVLRMYRAQTCDNLCLTVVANGVSVSREAEHAIREVPGARLCSVPGDKTIGYCMNFGIDQAGTDYWAKWDDDDLYGPHFFEDLLLQRKYAAFDITGKAAIFHYLEDSDTMHVRNLAMRDCLSAHVGGGTLLVRNPGCAFAEDGRGGEDSAFLSLARERGDRIVAGDPFNFVQVRRGDVATHTWTQSAPAMDLRGPRRRGLDLAGIFV
jgi:hypothetical protein